MGQPEMAAPFFIGISDIVPGIRINMKEVTFRKNFFLACNIRQGYDSGNKSTGLEQPGAGMSASRYALQGVRGRR
ncbi:hypothetical protein [Undibacterium terreum]|uniref:Uncharacterized protein n=1 Tax=Undibacterium terreum TaxID=1224302 RepID=A0A916XM05_9BURK|nr:hypothetical protein [Undibacterium terreum]GGC82761.1 hypothetical protein GCM10011396_32640 [Undibacterium terreum]